jgi:radical SAM superfamily enzyme YgiQ (UPF0313 family)
MKMRKMRIAGIYPQDFDVDARTQNMFGEPIGLESVLAVARREGHETKLFVPVREKNGLLESVPEKEFVEEVVAFKPNIAAFSLMTCQFNDGKRIAGKLKRRIPAIANVAGGRHPTAFPSEVGFPFDVFVLGEGEETFAELVEELGNGGKLGGVKGISFANGGKPFETGRRQFIKELSSLPDPLREPFLLRQAYMGLSLPPISEKPRYAIVEYSRGCPFKCVFCDAESVWQGCVRFKEARKVVAEMKRLQREHGINLFYFMDLNFTLVKQKVFEFCEEVERQGLETNWYCMSNIVTATRGVLEAMKEAGCFRVAYGVESTNNENLKTLEKQITAENTLTKEAAEKVLRTSVDIGLINSIFYIIGFPWETRESILRDARGLGDYCAHQFNVGIATPFPGTRWRTRMNPALLETNWSRYDRKTLVYRHETISAQEMKRLQEKIFREFYASPKYIEQVRELVEREPRLEQSFNDYFRQIELPLTVWDGIRVGSRGKRLAQSVLENRLPGLGAC